MNINISFVGMEPSDPVKKYAIEKLTKHEELFRDLENIEIVLKENVSTRGVDKDFRMNVNIPLPKAMIRVEESGSDMYAIVDKVSDILVRRLRRYYDRKENWEGVTPWRVIEAEEALNGFGEEEETLDNYVNYAPKIMSRKKLEDMTPLSEGEAIEKMELAGEKQILFKNKETSKISMIYARERGGYCLVEPSDALEL
ncbi:MAG: Sigma 54 modulation protein/ribosomal protein S30EA [candidate division WS6 bacterium GW2011_GWF2_39_15]|uniref:Sigma 54 modulation protein/ribosomal protein S30EA n=1 Tax=candidate division WS6 bacterium GW2011_GWF2_39_15 TaxID=1619100 RepID=A0A0G0MZI8_9BACT|nr:MAG: Sigma 54 modulation protein/ribosomal protein S30EA [candidate division WS6 bacterium GW2011_GWF2_39_15]